MLAFRVGAGVLVLGVVAACSDPVSRPTAVTADQITASDERGGDEGASQFDEPRVEVYDDCKPTDPGWAPTGGCTLSGGKVNLDEFNIFLSSPLSQSVVGHPAWRMEKSYIKIPPNTDVEVENEGGRLHTFTKVAQFGGGRVPPLNQGLTPAPECALAPGAPDPTALLPEGTLTIQGLTLGNHRYQCCIHPWMRALIKVTN
jgi:hypothetical protein